MAEHISKYREEIPHLHETSNSDRHNTWVFIGAAIGAFLGLLAYTQEWLTPS